MDKIPVYAEDKPHRRFLNEIKKWLKDRGLKASALLVSKSNLVIVIVPGIQGSSLLCFYIQKLCALGTGGIIVYYDLNTMSTRLKMNVENTFTNWVAQNACA
jgi:hypothetical protein